MRVDHDIYALVLRPLVRWHWPRRIWKGRSDMLVFLQQPQHPRWHGFRATPMRRMRTDGEIGRRHPSKSSRKYIVTKDIRKFIEEIDECS